MTLPLKSYSSLLVRYLRPQRGRVLVLGLLLAGSIGLQLASPQIVRSFIDQAQAGAPRRTLLAAAGLFLLFALLQQVVAVLATYMSENVGWTATNELRNDLAAHCLRLDLSFHKARTPGEIIERIDGDVNALSNFFSQFVVGLLSNFVLLAGVLVLLAREDWRIGLAVAAFAVGALLVLVRIRSAAEPHWNDVRERSALFFGFLGEQLAGTEDVRANGATGYVMRRFYEHLQAWLPVNRRANLWGYSMWMTTIGTFAVGNAVAFGLGAYLWSTGAITIGTVYLVFHYTSMLRHPVEQLRSQLQDLQQAGASIGRVQELFGVRSKLGAGHGMPLPAGAMDVQFEDVTFGYDDETVLDHVSFRLRRGTVLGLLGRTGSGKTTLARLLLRLYDPTAGAVYLGGVRLTDANLAHVRGRVGIVTQDVQLFNASVRDNLSFFDRTVDDGRIMGALEELGLAEWCGGLPEGLDTELEAGGGLSAGEAQLLAFARLFLADPGLVILDEASARLDPATERLIERAFEKVLQGRTAIIIAHRLPTVERADEIMILEHGRIVEHGERETLAATPGSRFSRLLQTGLHEVLA